MNSNFLKRSLVVAYKIVFFQFLIMWMLPFVPPMLAWGYVVFCLFAHWFIVEE